MKSGIYTIENHISERCYIGSAVKIERRLTQHKDMLTRGVHPNQYLQASWNKHSPAAFIFEPLLFCAESDLLFYEQLAIDAYRANGGVYNLAPRAGSQLGFKHSDKTRTRIAIAKRGKKQSPETIAKRSAALMGHAVSEHHRESTSARFKGGKLSVEHIAKLSAAKKGKKQSPSLIAKRALANTGKKRSEEARHRMSVAQKGHVVSAEHRAKMSAARLGIPQSAEANAKNAATHRGVKQGKLTCPTCLKVGGNAMRRWHFDNCKMIKL